MLNDAFLLKPSRGACMLVRLIMMRIRIAGADNAYYIQDEEE
jgi:hypothetical protein